MRRSYKHKQILILKDSQATLRIFCGHKVKSGLVIECMKTLNVPAEQNKVVLIVQGDRGIVVNETGDKLARQASVTKFIGPELTLGLPWRHLRKVLMVWAIEQHKIHMNN